MWQLACAENDFNYLLKLHFFCLFFGVAQCTAFRFLSILSGNQFFFTFRIIYTLKNQQFAILFQLIEILDLMQNLITKNWQKAICNIKIWIYVLTMILINFKVILQIFQFFQNAQNNQNLDNFQYFWVRLKFFAAK